MNQNDDDRQRTTIYLEPQITKALKEAAKDNGRSFTRQVETILREWLIDHKYLKKR